MLAQRKPAFRLGKRSAQGGAYDVHVYDFSRTHDKLLDDAMTTGAHKASG